MAAATLCAPGVSVVSVAGERPTESPSTVMRAPGGSVSTTRVVSDAGAACAAADVAA
jgi:hypothetical protein